MSFRLMRMVGVFALLSAMGGGFLPEAAAEEGGPTGPTPVLFTPFQVGKDLRNQEEVLRGLLSARMIETGKFSETATADTEQRVQECVRSINKESTEETCWIRLGQGQGARLMVTGKVIGDGKACTLMLSLVELETRVVQKKRVEPVNPCTMENLRAQIELSARALAGEKVPDRPSPVDPTGGLGNVPPPPQEPAPDVAGSGPVISGGTVTNATGNLAVEAKPFGKVRLEFVDAKGKKIVSGSPYRNPKAAVGTWQLKASANGYEPEERSFPVPPDETTLIKFELRQFGGLEVTGEPAGAEILVTGPGGFTDRRGLPWKAKGLKSGSYHIEVSRAGYQTYQRDADVEPGATNRIRVSLEKEAATPAVVRGGGLGEDALVRKIWEIPDGGSTPWDNAVKPLLIQAYDKDGSGAIDSATETNAVPCKVLQALNDKIRDGRGQISSLRGTYVANIYLGYLIGFGNNQRDTLLARIDSCGPGSGSTPAVVSPTPPTGGRLSEQELIRQLWDGPLGGSTEWDTLAKRLLLQNYDANRSGEIDTVAEVDAIPCAVWTALDDKIKSGRPNGSLVITYTKGYWLGYLLGINASMQDRCLAVYPSCKSGSVAASPSSGGRIGEEELVRKIWEIPDGGSTPWDNAVKPLMIQAYDTDNSGAIDRASETSAVPCKVLQALNDKIKDGRGQISSLRGTYIAHIYLGYLIGFANDQKDTLLARIDSCGPGSGSRPTTSSPAVPASGALSEQALIRALWDGPLGGSTEWDTLAKRLLLQTYDSNRSGEIDTRAEIDRIPCSVWTAMDDKIKSGRPNGSLVITYTKGLWLGYLLGINKSLQDRSLEIYPSCKSGGGAAASGGSLSEDELVSQVWAIPKGGSTEWDTATKALMLRRFDTNGSGSIDQDGEFRMITCRVWNALDKKIRDGRGSISGLEPTYVGYTYLGYLIGINEKYKDQMKTSVLACRSSGDGGSPSGTTGGGGRQSDEEIVRQIWAFPDGGSSEWDAKTKVLLVRAYDLNGSGMIDTDAELAQVSCAVWNALNEKIKTGRPNGGLEITYVSNPWLGHLYGMDKSMQAGSYAAIRRCNVRR
ncbi:MAG: PEGA domain-containing protein [Myxococcota bacterium]|jgi:hypothetical protein|nr:PEGA domain-containing protein [Myxococcota bacterium]